MKNAQRVTFQTDDGLSLVGDTAGPEGAPWVVLLHGGGQTRHSWSGELERLATAGYRVLSFDARGHGESDWAPDGDYSVKALARDLNTVLGHVDRPLALVGASMGGMTSFYAVGSSEEPLADALVMVDITLKPGNEGAKKILSFMQANLDGFASLEEATAAVAAYNPERKRTANPAGLMRNLRVGANGRLFWHWDPRLLQTSSPSEPPDMREDALGVHGNVTVPLMLVRGERSDVVTDEGVEEMRAILPQLEVHVIEKAGHMVAGDDNSTFHAGIIHFLERHLPLGEPR